MCKVKPKIPTTASLIEGDGSGGGYTSLNVWICMTACHLMKTIDEERPLSCMGN